MNDEMNDEISIWDIFNFLKAGSSWFAGGLFLGLVCAIGYLVLTPEVYEATVILKPATVANFADKKRAEVEPVAQTLERLKVPTFYTDEVVKLCEAPSMQALAASVRASQVRGNSLIQVAYRAPSVSVAKTCVNAVTAQMIKSQDAAAAPLIKALEEQLDENQRQLNVAMSFQKKLEKRALETHDSNLYWLMVFSNEASVEPLQKLVGEQKLLLSASVMQPMTLLESIYAPEKPVMPKKLLVLAGALFGGLVLGGLAFFVRRSWLARRTG